LDIARDKLSLCASALPASEQFRRTHLIPTGVLGHVHTGVSDSNDVLSGKAVYGEAGNAEAARDLAFLKHRVGGRPESQPLGQDLRLTNAGFGHQDDDLVASVTRDHVRLAALLFQQPADASQYEIALQVSEAVIDFFELVQIDQHDREGTPGARSAL